MASIAAAIAILVVTITTLGILFKYFLSIAEMKKKLHDRPPLPPGSLGLPLVGETFEYLKDIRGNKATFFDKRQSKYGLPFKTSLLGVPTVILEVPAGNKFVFANEGKLVQMTLPKSTKELVGPDSIHVQTGERYKSVRRHTASFLDPVSVAQYVPMVERITLDHLATLWQPHKGTSGKEEVDEDFELVAYDLMKNLTFRLMASLCLSLEPGPQWDELSTLFSNWGKGLLQVPINLPGFAYHRALQARAKILAILGKMMVKRKAALEDGSATLAEQKDVLSHLLTHPDDTGRMYTDGEIKDNILLFMNAGHDTSRSVLTMAIRFIAQNPTVYEHLREEHDAIARQKGPGEGLTQEDVRAMKYTWGMLLETMRLEPAVAGGFREATEDFEYDGYTILKGWRVMWTNLLSHKNPKFFDLPKEFNPSRFHGGNDTAPFIFMPFGGGPRLCPGNEFAKLEMLVFIHFVVRMYTWELAGGDTPVVRKPFPHQENGTPIKVRKLK